jgi:aspartate/tyrosine/aromatic aminotransferase
MFDSIKLAPPDPILGIAEAFKSDSRPEKINLTIGVYQDEHGRTPILESVKQAERILCESQETKGYLAIDGLAEFLQHARELALEGLVGQDRVATAQTPGGTGALKVAADLLRKNFGPLRIWVSTPTWPNHQGIFESAGLEVLNYPYLSPDKTALSMDIMLETLKKNGRTGDIVCLHGCCHNPSGIDPSQQQWTAIAEVLAMKNMLPLVDFAYQGFGQGLDEDRVGLKEIAKLHSEFLVCSSFSKNFGLYSERVGALLAVCPSTDQATNVSSSIKQVVRTNYSNPPRHGAAVIATILSDNLLRSLWMSELDTMRQRIHDMRLQFVETMKSTGCPIDFSFLLQQRGMFSFSGLNPMQVDWLKSQKGIYIVSSGRINVAGINSKNLPVLAQALALSLEQA